MTGGHLSLISKVHSEKNKPKSNKTEYSARNLERGPKVCDCEVRSNKCIGLSLNECIIISSMKFYFTKMKKNDS